MSTLSRRTWTIAAGAVLLAGVSGVLLRARAAGPVSRRTFAVNHSDEEWRRRLSAAQYGTLRKGRTERPYTSPLNQEARAGRFVCAGCGAALFSPITKFDSGTGWPSFWRALPEATAELEESAHPIYGTEVLCAGCGGHLGHVFRDGPRPTGLRYCMNGVALLFHAGAT